MAPPRDGPRFHEETERFWLLRLVTEVDDEGLSVRLHPLESSGRRLPTDDIERVAVADYAASDYGGWHWGLRRTPGGHTVYRLRGSRGVEVTRRDGTRLFVGSGRAEELAAALETVAEDG